MSLSHCQQWPKKGPPSSERDGGWFETRNHRKQWRMGVKRSGRCRGARVIETCSAPEERLWGEPPIPESSLDGKGSRSTATASAMATEPKSSAECELRAAILPSWCNASLGPSRRLHFGVPNGIGLGWPWGAPYSMTRSLAPEWSSENSGKNGSTGG